jgi:hypothetical protein
MTIGAMANCSDDLANIKMQHEELQDSAGVHRSKNPTAGSFTYHHNFAFRVMHPLLEGEELFLPCNINDALDNSQKVQQRKGTNLQTLQQHGMCIDGLRVGPSTLPGAGRGAFSKRTVPAGHVITPSPVIHFDRSQTEIMEQAIRLDDVIPVNRKHGIRYTANVTGQQLLLNYCYGSRDSNILLLPYAPGFNFINHSREKANAVVRWSLSGAKGLLDRDANLLTGTSAVKGLLIEVVAVRDIAPGEEILMDYGNEWTAAWEKHVRKWKSPPDTDYVSAADYKRMYGQGIIRTQAEQVTKPYPVSLRTACFFMADIHFTGDTREVEWENDNFDCLRPCEVKERSGAGVDTLYTALVYPMEIAEEPNNCGHIPKEGVLVSRLPVSGVGLVDRPYSTDVHLKSAFRHEIGVPDGFFPEKWNAADPNPFGDFETPPLKAGELQHVKWKDSGEVITPHAYRLGLGDRVRTKILEYCNKIGITDTFRKFTSEGNGLEREQNVFMEMNGHQWYLQRPGNLWQANMHWISPGGEEATQDWLEMLSEAGFDEVLKGIGETLNMTGLVAFHGTFIAASVSSKHYLHYDVTSTGAKHFNIIIPLLAASETGPELDIQDSKRLDTEGLLKFGRYRYEYDYAMMIGDDTYHATSPVDYRMTKEFRMAATVFVAEVTEENVDAILTQYTREF